MDNFGGLDLGQILGPGQAAAPSADLDLDSILGPTPQSAAKAAVVSAPAVAPEVAAKQVNFAPQIGLPPQVVDPAAAQDQLHTKAAVAAIDQHPGIADYVNTVPMAAQVSKDDFSNLGFFASAVKLLGTPEPQADVTALVPESTKAAIAQGFTQGYEGQNYARMGAAYQIGAVGDTSLKAYEDAPKPHAAGVNGFIQDFTNFLGMTASSAVYGGTTGAATGAGIGAFAGGLGAIPGAVIGFNYGTVADFLVGSVGQRYRAADLVRDDFGRPLPEGVKQASAVAAGMLTAGVLAATGGVAGPMVGAAFDGAFARVLGSTAAQSAIGRAAANLASAGISGGLVNTGITLAQQASDQVSKIVSGQQFKTVLNDPGVLQSYASEAAHAFLNGALLFGTLHALPLGASAIIDRLKVDQTHADAAVRDQVMAAAQQSQTLVRSPEMFQEFANRVAPGTVDIAAAKIAEIRAADKTAFDYVPGIDEKVAEATSRGGDVSIPAADYFTRTAPEIHEAVKDDIRSKTGLTVNDAKEVEKRTPESYQAQDPSLLPPVPDGHVRMFHGADDGTTPTESRWFTPSYDYAANFRRTEEAPKTVHFVDVPEDHPALVRGVEPEDVAAGVQQFYMHGELPADLSKRAQVVPYEAMADDAASAVKRERKALWLDPIIAPDAAGLSKADFVRYSKHIQAAQAEIGKAVFKAAEAEVRRRETRQWKAEASEVADQVSSDLRARPDWNAEQRLRGQGEFEGLRGKLDKDAVNELYSSEEQTRLGASPADLLQRDIVGSGGLDPNAMAQLSGHDSARAMVDDLIRLETDRRANNETPAQQFARQLKEETQARMEARHGKMEDKILGEAIDAVMSVQQLEVLRDDFKRIADAAGTPFEPLSRAELERWASDRIGGMVHLDAIKTEGFKRVVGRAGAAAEKALLKGDFVEAFKQKQLQMQNFLLARESARVAKDVNYVARQMDRLSKNTVVDGWEQEYTDAGHGLLQELGISVPRSEENLREALPTRDDGRPMDFATWAQSKAQKEQVDLIPPPIDLPRDPKALTSDQIGALRQTFKSLDYHAKLAQKIQIGERLEELNAAKSLILDNLADRADHYSEEQTRTMLGKARGIGRQIDAMQLRMEQFALWLDHNDPYGPFSQAVIRPLKEAQYAKDDMIRDLSIDLDKSLPNDKAWRKSLDQELPNSVLLDKDGNPMRLRRSNLVSMILNMGNESNMAKLTRGFKWDEGEVRRFVWENARKEDYEFAQSMWDVMDRFWPKIAEASRKATGVAAEKIPAKALDTPHGRYKGGYMPLLRDYESAPLTDKADIMEKGYTSPFVAQASSTKVRTGASYPLDLSLDQMPGRLNELIHAITHTEAVRNAQKVLADKDVQASVRDKYGPEYRDLLIPWLKNIAQNGGRYDSRGQKALARWSAMARQNMIFMLVGYRGSTALIHGGAALANSVGEVGLKNLTGAAKDLVFAKPEDVLSATDQIYRNPQNLKSMWSWAMEQSGELRNRGHNIDYDVGRVMDKATLGSGASLRERNMIWGTKLISTLDIMSAVPTWIAEYKSARMEGLTHEDAVYAGDQAVRQAHGSSALMDLPEIQRSPNFKFMTMFYGYFNHNYNRLRQLGRDVAGLPKSDNILSDTGHVALQSVAYLLAPALIHAVVRGHGPGEDENPIVWGLKSMAVQLGSSVVGLRDIISAWQTGQKAQAAGPLGELLSGVASVVTDAHKASEGKETPKAIQHALELPGWVTGLPFSRTQAGLGQYFWDQNNGNPRTDTDYYRLMLDGNPAPRKAH